MAKKKTTSNEEKKKLLNEAIGSEFIPSLKFKDRVFIPVEEKNQQEILWRIEDKEAQLKAIIKEYKRDKARIELENEKMKSSIHLDWEALLKNIDTIEALDKMIIVSEKLYQELF